MRHSGTVTTDAEILRAAVAGYARRLHAAAGSGHHVASPLGAWLLLALCAPATRNGAPPDPALAEVLGCDVDVAARLAGRPAPLPGPGHCPGHPGVLAAAVRAGPRGRARRGEPVGRAGAGTADAAPAGRGA